jgi:poly(A) polymerase
MRAILAALGGDAGQTRFVGGAVRDALLGLDVLDVDLATSLSPDDVSDRLVRAGLKAVPTGIVHGTITAVAGDTHVEVTTLRRDVSTDGRRATVTFTDDWREDAARRDFTINALYADPVSGEVIDYFEGLADLHARRLRFIGDPLTRIAEDHLRILRFFRFQARFGGERPDPAGLAACAARANDMKALSRERIRDELLKLLSVRDPAPTVALMLDHAILSPVLPEIDAAGLAVLRHLIEREAAAAVAADPIRRLAALLRPGGVGTAEAIGHRLRLSNRERERLVADVAPSAEPEDAAIMAYRLGVEIAVDRLLLGSGDPATVRLLDGWVKPRLPLSGGDLLALGLKGPAISAMLRTLESAWLAGDFQPSRDDLLERARSHFPTADSP